MLQRALLCCACALALACGSPADPEKQADGGVNSQDGGAEPLLQVGTGTDSFSALNDGDAVTIIAGPQGGYHVWTALRARAPLDPTGVSIHLRVLFNGAELSKNDYVLDLQKKGAYFEWYAMTAFIPDPTAVQGKEIELAVDVTDKAGLSASDSRRVIPQGP